MPKDLKGEYSVEFLFPEKTPFKVIPVKTPFYVE